MTTFYGPCGGWVTWPYVALFFGAVHSRAKWPERLQLKQGSSEAAQRWVVQVGASQAEVEVEP
jgi:hypothetical protein